MSAGTVSISLETYTYVLEQENLGDPHSTLIGGDRWYPPHARADRDARVYEELRTQGLVSGNHLSDEFSDIITVMQRAAVEYFTLANIDGRAFTYRTASIGRDAVLVSHEFGGMIDIEVIPHDQQRIRLAAALPAAPAARAHSASCSVTELQAVMEKADLPRTRTVADAKRIAQWLEQDDVASGELHVALRDDFRGGQKKSRPPVPLWVDSESGRVLLSQTSDGWLTFAGADLNAIADHLATMEDRVRRRMR